MMRLPQQQDVAVSRDGDDGNRTGMLHYLASRDAPARKLDAINPHMDPRAIKTSL